MLNLWWFAVNEHADDREREQLRFEVESYVTRFEMTVSSVPAEEYVPSWWKGDDEAAMTSRAATVILGAGSR